MNNMRIYFFGYLMSNVAFFGYRRYRLDNENHTNNDRSLFVEYSMCICSSGSSSGGSNQTSSFVFVRK